MRTYREKDIANPDRDSHNLYVVLRGEACKAVLSAKEKIESELGDRVSWQVFLAEMSGRYLAAVH